MRKILWTIGLVISVVLSSGTVSAADLRVMSFNIRYGTAQDGENHWDKRKEFVVECIREFAPDLLGTQETLLFQKDYLDEQLKDYVAIGVGREDGKLGGEMTALFYRRDRFEELEQGHFWLSEQPEVAGSKSWDSSLPRMCSWVKLQDKSQPTAQPILFINTHFDHRGQQARAESAALLRSKAKELGGDCDVVITGDFNAAVDSEPYQNLFAAKPNHLGLLDTYRILNPTKQADEGTFSSFRASETGGARIDWIAVSSAWKVKAAAIDRTQRDGRTPSDHFPVVTVLAR